MHSQTSNGSRQLQYLIHLHMYTLERLENNTKFEDRENSMWEQRGSTRCSQWVSEQHFCIVKSFEGWTRGVGGGLVWRTPHGSERGFPTRSYNQIRLDYGKQDRRLLCLKIEEIDIFSRSRVSEWTWRNIEGSCNEGNVSALIEE